MMLFRSQNPPEACLIVLTIKFNNDSHVCVDYNALDRITEKDAYPLPHVDEYFS